MELPFGNYLIRSWRKGDETSLVRYANNYKIWLNMDDRFPHPYTRGDAVEWIKHSSRSNPETNFAIGSSTEAIGGIGIRLMQGIYSNTGEIGYWLGEPFWGLGIATKALGKLTDWAFEKLGIIRLQALVFETNPVSSRVLEKAGYQLESRMKKYIVKNGLVIDALIYALVR